MPWLEFKITSLCESLMETVTLTRRHADKQQARSAEEKEAEIAEEEFGLLPVDIHIPISTYLLTYLPDFLLYVMCIQTIRCVYVVYVHNTSSNTYIQ